MLTLSVMRSMIDHLRNPFIQRLITLVISTLLAMSLISTTILLALPPSGHEVASSVFGQFVKPAHLDASRIQSFVPQTHVSGQVTPPYDTERRLV